MARYEPDTATARMVAARRHRVKAYAERNELVAVLAAMASEAHIMPVGEHLLKLTTKCVVCLHTPIGQLAWVISKDEAEEHFPELPRIQENHWDGCTADERSLRLLQLPLVWGE